MSPRLPVIAAGLIAATVAVSALAGCGGSDTSSADASRQQQLAVAAPDLVIAVTGTDASGAVVAPRVGRGVNVAIHRPKDGNPKAPGERVVVGSTDAKGEIRLYAFQPGRYVLVGPHDETKALTFRATQKAAPVTFRVCTTGC